MTYASICHPLRTFPLFPSIFTPLFSKKYKKVCICQKKAVPLQRKMFDTMKNKGVVGDIKTFLNIKFE